MKVRYYLIGLIGYFAVGKSKSGGQEAKTCAVAKALLNYYSRRHMFKIDTGNWKKKPFKFLYRVLYAIYKCKTLIIFPAQKSVQILSPLLIILGKPLRRKSHYVVIGGWLPDMLSRKKWLVFFLKKFDGIYVETFSMKTALENQGFKNVFIMPNFKNLPILKKEELVYTTKEPFSFCTFSRVMKEKGIEDAIQAIIQLNTQKGRTVAILDIYGKIDDNYKKRFTELQKNLPEYIKYKGVISPGKSVDVLKNYFALLFPTHYATEGIPGTLIDAYASGVPVISALWNNHKGVFVEKVTGFGFKFGDTESLFNYIVNAIQNPTAFNLMKPLCLNEAKKYIPQEVVKVLLAQLRGHK